MKLSARAAIQIIYFMPSVLAFSSCGGTRRYCNSRSQNGQGTNRGQIIVIMTIIIILFTENFKYTRFLAVYVLFRVLEMTIAQLRSLRCSGTAMNFEVNAIRLFL